MKRNPFDGSLFRRFRFSRFFMQPAKGSRVYKSETVSLVPYFELQHSVERKGMERFIGDPDAHLVSKAQLGDSLALGELLNRYQEYLYTIIQNRGVNRADIPDVVQDVKKIVCEKIADFVGRSTFQTWLTAIASNMSITFTRKYRPITSLPTNLVDRRSGDESAFSELYADCLQYSSEILDIRDRALLLFRFLKNKQYKEIAKRWHTPEGTLKARQFRALEKLRMYRYLHKIAPETLNLRERAILIRYFKGGTYSEIVDRWGMEVKDLKSLRTEALKKLSTHIRERFGEAAPIVGDGSEEALPSAATCFDADRLLSAENRLGELHHELKSLESAAGVGDLVNAIHEELESLTAYQTWCKRRLLAFVENIAEEHLNEGE